MALSLSTKPGRAVRLSNLERTQVTLSMRQGPITVEAFRSATPGLVVHREAIWAGEGSNKIVANGSMWVISHARTGLRVVGYLPTRNKALALAEAIGPLTKWDRPLRGKAFGPKGLGKKVNKVRLAVLERSAKGSA